MTEQIKIENAENILTLTFARPDKKNALTNVMYGALADAIVAADADQAVRAIVIRGKATCSRPATTSVSSPPSLPAL